MKLNEAIAQRIKCLMKQRGLSGYALFKLTGIPQSTITTLLKCKVETVRLSTIYNLCSGLGIGFTKFFNCDYFKLENVTL